MINNQLYFIKDTIYRLKIDYGGPLDVYHVTSETQDVTTGRKLITKIKYIINNAVILPTYTAIQLSLSGAFQRQFTATGLDVGQKVVLIDEDDLPINFDINIKDYIIIEHERYEIKNITKIDGDLGTLLTLKSITGAQPFEIFDLRFKQVLRLRQRAVNA